MQDPSLLFQPEVLLEIARSAVRYATPLILAGTGEAVARRTGVLNLGLEGILAMGAFMAFFITDITGNMLFGFLSAILVGMVFSFLHGFMTVSLKEKRYAELRSGGGRM